MSSSTGNTIGPLEALELVPPQVLRYLIASTKPKKAITFDAGMSLVELADEFERLASRDIDAEMQNDDLSRRQKVALEDAEGALRMSRIGDKTESIVSFRHLSMLAQVKSDEEIITSYGSSLRDRLDRMKNWIQGPYFPEELRIKVLDAINPNADKDITMRLHSYLSGCEWDAKSIGDSISLCFRESEISPRDGYKALYNAILGVDKGPRLAPILSELDRERVLTLLG